MRCLARFGTPLLAFAALALAGCSAAKTDHPVVVIEVKGIDPLTKKEWTDVIEAELYPDKAPATVKNFLDYVDARHYDDTLFHRVVNGYVIQGGGFGPGMERKEVKSPIANESNNGLSNKKGTLAMARTKDPNSATDQFFINVADNDRLDATKDQPGYCVFGKVIQGMHAVDRIKRVPTAEGDVPLVEVTIVSIRRGPLSEEAPR